MTLIGWLSLHLTQASKEASELLVSLKVFVVTSHLFRVADESLSPHTPLSKPEASIHFDEFQER